jgi:hypothetical protein
MSISTEIKTEEGKKTINPSEKAGRLVKLSWVQDTLNRANLVKLALISIFLAAVDTVQSYYLQRVVNQFSEVNLLPLKFYSTGPLGYALYFPIDFVALYGTLTVLWIWASYILWYHKHVVATRVKFDTS